MISLIPCPTSRSELPYISLTRPETKLHDFVIDLTGKSTDEGGEVGVSRGLSRKRDQFERATTSQQLTDWRRNGSLDEPEEAILHDRLEGRPRRGGREEEVGGQSNWSIHLSRGWEKNEP